MAANPARGKWTTEWYSCEVWTINWFDTHRFSLRCSTIFLTQCSRLMCRYLWTLLNAKIISLNCLFSLLHWVNAHLVAIAVVSVLLSMIESSLNTQMVQIKSLKFERKNLAHMKRAIRITNDNGKLEVSRDRGDYYEVKAQLYQRNFNVKYLSRDSMEERMIWAIVSLYVITILGHLHFTMKQMYNSMHKMCDQR